MLSFTQNTKLSGGMLREHDFQPLVIINKLPIEVSPKKSQKKIVKVSQGNGEFKEKDKKRVQKNKDIHIYEQQSEQWKNGGKIQVFDKRLKKDQLAAEERKLKAQKKKQKEEIFKGLVSNEKQIRAKAINIQKEQKKQIEHLKKLIEEQKKDKEKNDKAYEIQLRQIQKQRQLLLELQKKIQKNGAKGEKQYKKELQILLKNEVPETDRAKCRQQVLSSNQKGFQVTQSEVNYQRNELRQHQLDYLIQQRERCMKNMQLNYSASLIPLLSKASYKIISTHISTLVQLFVDDLLEEQVYLLQQIDLREKYEQQKKKEQQIIQDYYRELDEFVDEAEQIQNRVGRYQSMKFEDLYIPKNYQKLKHSAPFEYTKNSNFNLCLNFDQQTLEEIQNRKDRFIRFVSNFDEYKKGNTSMFEKVTEEIIDEAIDKLAKQLDKGSADFVDLIFRNQLK